MPRTPQRKGKDSDEYNPDEILWDLFEARVVLTDFRKSLPPPPPPLPSPPSLPKPPLSWKRPRKRLSYSSASDSETDEQLFKELDLTLAEPEEPVKQRMEKIRKNRKKAEANRVRRMKKRQKEAEIITAIAAGIDGMSPMLHNMGKWFKEFELEDMVAQATRPQLEYTHSEKFPPSSWMS